MSQNRELRCHARCYTNGLVNSAVAFSACHLLLIIVERSLRNQGVSDIAVGAAHTIQRTSWMSSVAANPARTRASHGLVSPENLHTPS